MVFKSTFEPMLNANFQGKAKSKLEMEMEKTRKFKGVSHNLVRFLHPILTQLLIDDGFFISNTEIQIE